MQEYVEERTIAISIKAAKLSGRALAAACKKVLAEMKKHHEAAKRPHGRQSVKKLMKHYGTKSAMKYVGAPKDFDRIKQSRFLIQKQIRVVGNTVRHTVHAFKACKAAVVSAYPYKVFLNFSCAVHIKTSLFYIHSATQPL